MKDKATVTILFWLLLATSIHVSSLALFGTRIEVEASVDQHGRTLPYQTGYQTSSQLSSLPVEWNRTYGGHDDDYAKAVVQTSDGGYAFAGYTYSHGNGSYDDFWLVKTDSSGTMQWNKTYGGAGNDEAYSLVQASDGGYALAGVTSFGSGNKDFWLVKTDSSGTMQWNKTYGGTGIDEAQSLEQTSDNGYVIAGDTASFGAGGFDFWVVKTDSFGSMQWNKTYGGSGTDIAYSVRQTTDGGYAVAGYTNSLGAGSYDVWLIKLDVNGNEQWNETYGGKSLDVAYSLQQTTDGGYILAGSTSSSGAGQDDFFLVKTDDFGNQQWNKTYGGTSSDLASYVIQTKEGGYAIVGVTSSFGAGLDDAWLVKTDVNGNVQWNATYGGSNYDSAESIRQTVDAGFILAGYTFSYGSGGSDAWLIRLASADIAPPFTINDYDGLWHNSDFTITLTATDDLSGVNETYYAVNGGLNKTIKAAGQPRITVESANNTLVFWSDDYAGHVESPKVLTGIKLDQTPPVGSFMINEGARYANSSMVDLSVSASDATSGVSQTRYSNDNVWDTEVWEAFSPTKLRALSPGDGNRTVYYQVKDNAGLVSATVSHSIIVDTTLPEASLVSPVDVERLSSSTVNFNASAVDFESGISRVELFIDDEFRGNMTLTSGGSYVLTVSALSNGDHTWFVKAYNGAGSVAASEKRAFSIQTGGGPQGGGFDYRLLFYVIGALAVVLVGASVYYVFRRRKRQSES